ncbi:MAG: hypothetical protein Q9184_004710 [Pyrenodesmia sp. 2 TL-2023]
MQSGSENEFSLDAFDPSLLPDFDREFINRADVEEFAKALNAPESEPLVALNDWRPIRQRIRRSRNRSRRKEPIRSKDEVREGFVYNVLKWPFLFIVLGWILALCVSYVFTRLYIWAYERSVTWRGRRQTLRRNLQSKTSFAEWRTAADALDDHLGNGKWKAIDEYAYYDHATVRRVKDQLRAARLQAQQLNGDSATAATDRLKSLVEASLKSNAFGVENPRMYSETYRGTKNLAQAFIEELHAAIDLLLNHSLLKRSDKYTLAKHLHRNFGRTALCLSGGSVVFRATLPYRTSGTRFDPI